MEHQKNCPGEAGRQVACGFNAVTINGKEVINLRGKTQEEALKALDEEFPKILESFQREVRQ